MNLVKLLRLCQAYALLPPAARATLRDTAEDGGIERLYGLGSLQGAEGWLRQLVEALDPSAGDLGYEAEVLADDIKADILEIIAG